MSGLSKLSASAGSRKKSKRLGRGNGSGKGTFSGRGCKGQNARSGQKVHPQFEGGQSPLFMRLPKKGGFKPVFRVEYSPINLDDLEAMAEKGIQNITKLDLFESGYIRKKDTKVKLLAFGKVKTPVTLVVDAVSISAQKKLEKIGGKIVLTSSLKE